MHHQVQQLILRAGFLKNALEISINLRHTGVGLRVDFLHFQIELPVAVLELLSLFSSLYKVFQMIFETEIVKTAPVNLHLEA